MGNSEGYLWSWGWWGYLSQRRLCKGVRCFSASGYHLLKANCSVYLREEVSHRGSLGTTCRDEGMSTGNDLTTLSQTPLTSFPDSPDINILLGHNGGSRLLLMGMLLSHPLLPTGHPGSCSRSSHPTVSQPDSPASLPRAQIPFRHGWGSPPQCRPHWHSSGASGLCYRDVQGPWSLQEKAGHALLGKMDRGICLPSRYSPKAPGSHQSPMELT